MLDMLLLKDFKINNDILAKNLYCSYHKSFIRLDKEFLKLIKIYNNYEILNEKKTTIGDLKNEYEYKYIVKTDKLLFIRIIQNDLLVITDILVYDVYDYEYFKKIFFKSEELKLDDYLNNETNLILHLESCHLKIIKNEFKLLKMLKYEAWDYDNKHNNYLDNSFKNKNILNKIYKRISFKENVTFFNNGDELIDIFLEFKYYKDDFYIVIIGG